MLLEHVYAAPDRLDAPQRRRPDAALYVGVEELGDAGRCLVGSRLALHARPPRIAVGLDFADEEALPVARFLHRLDRPLFPRFHPGHRELVDRHAVARALVHHVEPQVLEAPSAVLARAAPTSSSDRHVTSFIRSSEGCYDTAR